MQSEYKFLSNSAEVSDEIRRVINNGFYSHHPFKYSSGQLEDYISIYLEMRALPIDSFKLCVEAIERVLKLKAKGCDGCYGKGLAYLMFLTRGLLENDHARFRDQFMSFGVRWKGPERYEKELRDRFASQDIELAI